MTTVDDKIALQLIAFQKAVTNPDRKSNVGAALFEVYLWQQVLDRAEDNLETAWKALAEEGVIPTDDKLRTQATGDHIEAESEHFSCLVKIASGQNRFNKEDFIAAVAKKFKIPAPKLEALADTCKRKSNPSLTKKVLEV